MKDTKRLESIAKDIRKIILRISYKAQVGHVGSAFSIVEILTALYFHILNINPGKTKMPTRDRFILSKGHAAPALYAVLYKKGIIDAKTLAGYCRDGGLLEEHPSHHIKGIEISTGSLGHGLSIGVGMSLAGKIKKSIYRVFVLMSDAELNEGETWAAALSASHYHLENLYVFLDYNKVQALGKVDEILGVEPLKKKWLSFGWDVVEVDGHDVEGILHIIERKKILSQPTIIICHTIRGKGVTFMEHTLKWHYLSPSKEHIKRALAQLK